MSAEMVREIAKLRLSEAEAFFSIVVHVDARGVVTPTITVMAPNLSRQHQDAMQTHLQGMAETLRAGYAPRTTG